jgi:dihydrofolate synthase/folylpolyglutamate synthase
MKEAALLLDELFALRRFGMKPGLETVRALWRELGFPGRNLRYVHIAGTNGKGSVAAFLEAVLRAAGYRVGLYTSPHLVKFGERIKVAGVELSEESLVSHYARMRPALDRVAAMEGLRRPTFFETATALALQVFEEASVEWVVWETGMGGRWDATNIVRPEVCVITSIGLDHRQFLGETLSEIACEKAGIMKEGVACVTAPQSHEVNEVLRDEAAKIGAKLVEVADCAEKAEASIQKEGQQFSWGGKPWEIGLFGPHQRINASTALTAWEELVASGFVIGEDAARQGLASARWPGRFHVLRRDPPWVVDGAHNQAGARRLAETWRELFPGVRPHLIFGVLDDKDAEGIARELAGWVMSASVVRAGGERASSPSRTAAALRGARGDLAVEEMEVERALSEAETRGGPVLVAGSLYLAGEVLGRKWGQ